MTATPSGDGAEPLGLLARLHPRRMSYPRLLAALVIGALGGWGFALAQLPLPWMLGSMSAVMVAALLHVPIGAPGFVRTPMTMVIGVLLGSSFKPEALGHMAEWVVPLTGLLVFSVVCAVAGSLYFLKVAKVDTVTAYFAGMPGGLIDMVIQGEERGGDARFIALVHAARIFLIVMSLPFLVQALTGLDLGTRPALGPSLRDVPLLEWAWLIGAALLGWRLGLLLRLPAAALIGPMLLSGVVHLAGLTDFIPAREVVIAAQVVIGTIIGCRFLGLGAKAILRMMALSGGYTLVLLAITLAFAAGLPLMTDLDTVPLLLAYSPGGLAEMSLVALSLQIEVAFVATHHIVRVLIVMLGATPAFALVRRIGVAGGGGSV